MSSRCKLEYMKRLYCAGLTYLVETGVLYVHFALISVCDKSFGVAYAVYYPMEFIFLMITALADGGISEALKRNNEDEKCTAIWASLISGTTVLVGFLLSKGMFSDSLSVDPIVAESYNYVIIWYTIEYLHITACKYYHYSNDYKYASRTEIRYYTLDTIILAVTVFLTRDWKLALLSLIVTSGIQLLYIWCKIPKRVTSFNPLN